MNAFIVLQRTKGDVTFKNGSRNGQLKLEQIRSRERKHFRILFHSITHLNYLIFNFKLKKKS